MLTTIASFAVITTCSFIIFTLLLMLLDDVLPANRRCRDSRCWGTEYKGHLHDRRRLTLRGKLRDGQAYSLVHAHPHF